MEECAKALRSEVYIARNQLDGGEMSKEEERKGIRKS